MSIDEKASRLIGEIRNQLEINVSIARRDHPEGMMIDGARKEILPHSQAVLAGHITDKLAELEAHLAAPRASVGIDEKALEAAFEATIPVIERAGEQGGFRGEVFAQCVEAAITAYLAALPAQPAPQAGVVPAGDDLKAAREAALEEAAQIADAITRDLADGIGERRYGPEDIAINIRAAALATREA